MPEGIKHRYFDLIIFKNTEDVQTIEDEIARNSALGRLEGLQDGWELGLKRPILGYGPGTSAIARKEVQPNSREMELHNLYGQIFSETGFIGAFLFLLIMLTYFFQLHNLRYMKEFNSNSIELLDNYKVALRNGLLILLFYGFSSHTLYRYQWFILFACHGAFIDIVTHVYKSRDVYSKTD